MFLVSLSLPFFFFNDTATTEIYTLSLHDALPICNPSDSDGRSGPPARSRAIFSRTRGRSNRSEEHTSELQSLAYLVCRLLLEKKKNVYGGTRSIPPAHQSLLLARTRRAAGLTSKL